MTSTWGWRAELREFVAWVGYRKRRRTALNPRTGHWVIPTLNAGMGANFQIKCYEPEGAACRMVVKNPQPAWVGFLDPPELEDCGFCFQVDFYAQVGGAEDYYEGPDDQPVVAGPITLRYEASRGEDDDGAFYWQYAEEV